MNILIGIGGVSRSGKTFLAQQLEIALTAQNHTTLVIHQDQCVFKESELPLIKGKPDWEHPVSIDWIGLKELISEGLKSYDIVIVEGLLAFNDPELVELMSHKIFLEISKRLFVARKRKDLRWGLEPDWYIEHIWESYLRSGRPTLGKEYFCLNGARPCDLTLLLDRIMEG